MDWEFVKQQSRIVDIKHARRIPSEQECKIIDADKRVMKKLRVKKLSINKQPGICVKPSLDTSNVQGNMFNENAEVSQVMSNASSKRNASGVPSSYFLRTSTDVVTLFFYPFKRFGKVASRKKLGLTEEDMLGLKVSDFFYNWSRKRRVKKKSTRGVKGRLSPCVNIFPTARNASKSGVRVRKTRKKKNPAEKRDRVMVKQDPVHRGPRYNISFQEVWRAYGRIRKGRGFYPSNKVLWRNRHALVLGCSNFYRKAGYNDVAYLNKDNIEYDIVEPPESSPDPQVPTSGPEFSSDEAGDGPVKPKCVGKASQGASGRGGVGDKKNDRDRDLGKQNSAIVDGLLEETMMDVGEDQTECGLLTLFKRFDGRERNDDLRKQINKLERMIETGQGNVCLRAMLRSKKNQLHDNMCRSSPSTPTESEDEEQDEPYVVYDGENQCDGKTFVNYINGGQSADDANLGSITLKKQKLKIRKSYMENEAFLSKNCYGGGKKKQNDSDVDYDPEDAKKRKRRRARKKQNRKRKTGDKRSSQQKARVQVANARTNADRPKGDNRPSEQIARVQVANARTNADRPKADNMPSEQIARVEVRNSTTNPKNNPK